MRCKVARREDQTAGALAVRDACHRACLGNTKLPPFLFLLLRLPPFLSNLRSSSLKSYGDVER
jgi:hypothetical protein